MQPDLGSLLVSLQLLPRQRPLRTLVDVVLLPLVQLGGLRSSRGVGAVPPLGGVHPPMLVPVTVPGSLPASSAGSQLHFCCSWRGENGSGDQVSLPASCCRAVSGATLYNKRRKKLSHAFLQASAGAEPRLQLSASEKWDKFELSGAMALLKA